MMKKILLLTQILLMTASAYASSTSTEFGPAVLPDQCIPYSGESLDKIETITFKFDLTATYGEYPEITPENVVIKAASLKNYPVQLFRGAAEDGNLLASAVVGSAVSEVGSCMVTVTLDKECTLVAGETYTISVPKDNTFSAAVEGQNAPRQAKAPAFSYEIYGSGEAEGAFELHSFTPGLNSPSIDAFSLTFTQEVKLAADAKAYLYEGETLLGESVLSVDENNPCNVVGSFDNIPLYTTHTYDFIIAEGAIIEKSSDSPYPAIELKYKGTAYHYFSYGRVTPSIGSEVSYLTTISVPCRGIPDGYNLYTDTPTIVMYEGDSTTPMTEIRAKINEASDGWEIPVWNFNLSPSTEYRFVLAADQSNLWEPGERTSYVKVEDWANPELVLTYTTPAVLEEAPIYTFETVDPSDVEAQKYLGMVTVTIAPYELETISYLPILMVESPMADFLQDGEAVKSVALTLSYKDEGDSSTGVLSAKIDETLLNGHEYSLVIPAGIIGPAVGPTFNDAQKESFQNAVKNAEYVVTYQGGTPTEATVTYCLGETGSMSTVVKIGESVTVNVAGSDDWKVSEVLFNDVKVDIEGSEYVTPAITEDTQIAVTYEYAHVIDFDFTTGVGQVEDCTYGVGKDGSHVVITGLKGGDKIVVYTVGGMKVAELPAVPADMDEASIVLPENQVYLILINDTAIKYKH